MNRDTHFEVWSQRSTIADCLRDLSMPILAVRTMRYGATSELIKGFLHIIRDEAFRLNRHDVLERLFMSGLIYG